MTKEEIKQWMAGKTVYDYTYENDDGNVYRTEIFEVGDELYAIDYCNDCITEKFNKSNKWDEMGYIRGVYEPRKVKAVTRTYTVTEYEDV